MTRWWKERSEREQILLVTGSVICGLFAIYMLIYLPLQAQRDSAEASLDRTRAMFEDVSSTAREVVALRAVTTRREQSSDASLRNRVTEAAKAHRLTIARLEPAQDGGMTVWVESAPVQTVQKWIAELYQDDGIAVVKVSLQKNDQDASVRAQVQFGGGSE